MKNFIFLAVILGLTSCISKKPKPSGGSPVETTPPEMNNTDDVIVESNLNNWEKNVFLAHNNERIKIGADIPQLKWSPKLADYAQEWADQLAQNDCSFHHRTNLDEFGENLAKGGSSDGYTAEQLVQLWIDEKKDYNSQENSCNGVCGHYTQMIWKSTEMVGCGLASCNSDRELKILVCNYFPAGNDVAKRPF